MARLQRSADADPGLPPQDRLSRLNVREQMAHVCSYPDVGERVAQGRLRVHGWWFDIASADVYALSEDGSHFAVIDEGEAERILARIDE